MKRTFKKAISVFLVVAMLLCAAPLNGLVGLDLLSLFDFKAQAATYSGSCGKDLTWSLDTDTGVLNITGTGAMTNYSSYSSAPWYSYSGYIKTVNIASGVTSIGSSAFYSCDSLTSITIGNSVTSIGISAFYSCTSLTNVTIGNSVTSIGDRAFNDCDSLTSVTIPDSVTTIGEDAFRFCDSLTSVTIPDSVTSIGSYAFALSEYSTDYRIMIICNKDSYAHQYAVENSVPYMFADGTKEENTISGSVGKKLSWSIDKATRKLTVENDGTMVAFVSESAPWEAYAGYILYAEIKYGCTNISNSAFGNCRYLKAVDIPYSVTTIDESAFYGCDSLTSITIPDSVKTIGNSAFRDCDSLTSVTIPNSVTTIDHYVFYSCDSLTSVKIGNSVTSIGYSAFAWCYSLTSVTIPDSVTSIGEDAFYDCTSLTSVTIGNSVTYIGVDAFCNCDSLTSVTIPDSVTSIGSSAFQSCDSLSAVTVGSGVKTISSYAFANCAKLYDIYIRSKTCTINSDSITINATIHGYAGSTAETFADKYGYNFEPIVDISCDVHTYTDTCDATCDVCGAKREITHSYGEWTIIKEPTCTSTGAKQRICSVCSNVEKETIPTIPHSYGEWTIIKEATCTSTGAKQRICSAGGCVEKATIEMVPHTDANDDGICEVCKTQFEIKYSMHGVCGPDLTWTLDDDGVLTIEGTGSMYDFNSGDYITVYPGREETTREENSDWYIPEWETSTPRTEITVRPTSKPEHTSTYPTTNRPVVTHPWDDDYNYTTYVYNSVDETPIKEETCSVQTEESTTAPEIVPQAEAPEVTTRYYETSTQKYYPPTTIVDWYYPETTTVDWVYPETTHPGNVKDDYITVYRWNKHIDKIKKVVIGEGVTSIGDYAFSNCTQLSEVEMADSITSIGYYAFNNCSALEEIEIPENVYTIENYAFYNCSALETIEFNANNCNNIYYNAFYNTSVKILNVGVNVNQLPDLYDLETVTFADGATIVPYGAFSGCTKLTTVNLPDSIKRIEDGAFYNCDSLQNFVTPASTTYVGQFSFENCDLLSEVTIGENVEFISYDAFRGCYNLSVLNFNAKQCDCSVEGTGLYSCNVKTLNVGPGVTNLPDSLRYLETVTFADGAEIVPPYAFSGCSRLTTVNLPDSMKFIEYEAFYNCDSLADIDIPESVTYIGNYAFEGCDALTEITIPENLTELYWSAFHYCSNLSTLNFNAKNLQVESDAFYGCPITTLNVGAGVSYLPNIRSLKSVTFADGATVVPEYAFSNCIELESVTLPDSIKKIGYCAFNYCTKIENIVLPKNLKAIAERSFYACYNLKTADLPDSIERIERCAFDNCTSLQSVDIPDTVEYIGPFAFYGCTAIKTLTIPENVTEIGQAAFGCCYALESVEYNAIDCSIIETEYDSILYDAFYLSDNISSVKFGSKVTVIPAALMQDKTKLTSAEIPSSVKEIKYNAFRGTSLSEIKLPDSIEIIGIGAFAEIKTVTSLTIPESVCVIGCYAFAQMPLLERVNFNAVNAQIEEDFYVGYSVFANSGIETEGIIFTFGESVEVVPDGILTTGGSYGVGEKYEANVQTVIIGDNVKAIGNYAFENCSSIANITFGNSVETIGARAFEGCYNIKNIALPDSLRTIGENAFRECTGLAEITIPENIESISITAFMGCTSVETINYNAINANISYSYYLNVFSRCTGVKTVNIGDCVEVIPAYTFTGCENLKKIYIPDIVISIDPLAFDGCGKAAIVCKNGSYANVFAVQNNIKYILEDNAKGTAFEIRNDMLLGYNGTAQNVVLPSKIDAIGIDAFKGNEVVKSIELPYSVTTIYPSAFANCPNLESVIIPFTVTDIADSAFDGTDATIYCYYNSYAYNYAVKNGLKYELITITLSTNSVDMLTGESIGINAVPSVTVASGIPMVWKSSNADVVSVDSAGKLVANGVGSATVGVYSFDGTLFDECSVTVSEPVDEFENVEIKFEDVSTGTLKYGEKILFHINVADLPEGASIKWATSNGAILQISNENAVCSNHEGCVTCTVESVGNGSAEITGTVVDENGDPVLRDGEEIKVSYTMNSKVNFWQKIIAFFRKLFGIFRIILQSVQ